LDGLHAHAAASPYLVFTKISIWLPRLNTTVYISYMLLRWLRQLSDDFREKKLHDLLAGSLPAPLNGLLELLASFSTSTKVTIITATIKPFIGKESEA